MFFCVPLPPSLCVFYISVSVYVFTYVCVYVCFYMYQIPLGVYVCVFMCISLSLGVCVYVCFYVYISLPPCMCDNHIVPTTPASEPQNACVSDDPC